MAASRRGCPTSAMAWRIPVWSPDGSRLAFVARVGGYHAPEREEDKQKSRPARVITTLKYRYNGEGFTYDRRRHVFVVAAAGGPARQLTDGEWDDADPAWSPDGRIIAFSSARHPDRDLDDSSDLWVVDADGGEARRVTDTAGPRGAPRVFPRRARHRVSRPALEERVRAERACLHRGDRTAGRPGASRSGSTAPARRSGRGRSGRPTGGRSPSPPRTRARSASIASGRRTARRRCG